MQNTIKKIIYFTSFVLTLMCVLCFGVSALEKTGQCGDDVYWNYNKNTGELVISGTGEMWNYSSDFSEKKPSPFLGNFSIKSVIIEYGVTSIGDWAFCTSPRISSLSIPVSVTRIGTAAFANSDLINVDIPFSVTTIGDEAFCGGAELTQVNIGNNVTTIGASAFSGCESLVNINIPDSVITIGDGAFAYCKSLVSVNIGNGVTTIGHRAFQRCYNLESITFGNSLESIGYEAFYSCEKIASISLPESLTTISGRGFYFCEGLTSVGIPDSVTTVGEEAFSCCYNLSSVDIGDGLTTISEFAFYNCTSLENITIGKNVTTIEEQAFGYCNALTSLNIPDGVTEIKDYAFLSCKNLLSVYLPESVTSIGTGIFNFSDSIKDIYYAGSEGQWNNIKINSNLSAITIHYGKISENESGGIDEKSEYLISDRIFSDNIDYFIYYTDSSVYNTELANMTAALSKDVYSEKKILEDYATLGFDNTNVLLCDYDGAFDPLECGFAIGFKKSDYSDDTVCLITVRGSSNISDWVGNVSLLTLVDGKHTGFSKPANRMYNVAKDLAAVKGFSGSIKYVITGHSRGAAVANLLAVKLMENGVSSSDIYNYNFACPDVACKYVFTNYNNIFNICNRLDLVPLVPGHIATSLTTPGTSWGKYGKTYWFTSYNENRKGLVPDHDMGLYLKHLDRKLLPSEWEKTSGDEFADKVNTVIGWITKVFCPVDVTVTDVRGNPIASVIGGQVNYYNSKFGDVIILTDGDRKVIYVNGGKQFNVSLMGTDNGKMMYSLEKYNPITNVISESKTFTDVELKRGKTMFSPVSSAAVVQEVKLYVTESQNGTNINSYVIGTDGSEKEINHVYKAKVYNPTYKSKGYTVYTCSCGHSYTVAGKKMLTLKKPTSLKAKTVKLASKGKSKVTLTWSKVTGAEKYEVYQYVSKKWKKIKTTSSTSYTVSKLTAGKSYKFKVRAIAGTNKGAYSSSFTAKVVPLKTSVTLKTGKKQLIATWKTVSGATGYELVYSTSKKFTKKTTKTVTIKKAKTNKTTIKKLKKGKKYYVKVRAYKTVSGKKIYGAFSSVKNVKVK